VPLIPLLLAAALVAHFSTPLVCCGRHGLAASARSLAGVEGFSGCHSRGFSSIPILKPSASVQTGGTDRPPSALVVVVAPTSCSSKQLHTINQRSDPRNGGPAPQSAYRPVRCVMRCLTAAFPLTRAAKPKRVALHATPSRPVSDMLHT
jgi:hypothetical protein